MADETSNPIFNRCDTSPEELASVLVDVVEFDDTAEVQVVNDEKKEDKMQSRRKTAFVAGIVDYKKEKPNAGNFPFASNRHQRTTAKSLSRTASSLTMSSRMFSGTLSATNSHEKMVNSRKDELHRRVRRDTVQDYRRRIRRSTIASEGVTSYELPREDCAGLLADYVNRIAGNNYSLQCVFEGMAEDKCYSAALRICRSEDAVDSLMRLILRFMQGKNVPGFGQSVKGKLFGYASEVMKLGRQSACLKDEVVAWSLSYKLRHSTIPKQPLTADDAWNEHVKKFWRIYSQLFDDRPLAELKRFNRDGAPLAKLRQSARTKSPTKVFEQGHGSASAFAQSQVLWKNRAARSDCMTGSPARPRSATSLDVRCSMSKAKALSTGRSQSVGELRRRMDETADASEKPKPPMRALMRNRSHSVAQSRMRPLTAPGGRKLGHADFLYPNSPSAQSRTSDFSGQKLVFDMTLKPGDTLTEQNVSAWEEIVAQANAMQDESEERVNELENSMSYRKTWKGTASMHALAGSDESEAVHFALPKPDKLEADLAEPADFLERRKLAAGTLGKDANLPMRWYAQVCWNQQLLPSPNPFVIGYSSKITAGPKALYDDDIDAIISMVKYASRIEEVDLEGSSCLSEKKIHAFIRSLIGNQAAAHASKINFKAVKNF
jgi:hypothetical protein